MDAMTPEYAAALKVARAAAAKFAEAQKAYRACKIGDAEFIAARQEFQKSQVAFDAAFAAEAAR